MNAKEPAQLAAEVNAENTPVPFDVILDGILKRIDIAASFGRTKLLLRHTDLPPDIKRVPELCDDLRNALLRDRFQVHQYTGETQLLLCVNW